jgi:hypothetical protein
MKIILAFASCFLLLVSAGGCEQPVQTPERLTVNDWPVTILPTTDDPEDNINFYNITITKGILEQDYFTPWAGDHKKGEACFLITGKVTNDSSTRYWVTHFVDGLDNAGNRVAGTLDAGPLVGIAQVGIEPHSTENFTLHLGWADNVTSFTLQSQKGSMPFP